MWNIDETLKAKIKESLQDFITGGSYPYDHFGKCPPIHPTFDRANMWELVEKEEPLPKVDCVMGAVFKTVTWDYSFMDLLNAGIFRGLSDSEELAINPYKNGQTDFVPKEPKIIHKTPREKRLERKAQENATRIVGRICKLIRK